MGSLIRSLLRSMHNSRFLSRLRDHALTYSSVKLQNLVGRLRDHTLPYSSVKLQNPVGRLRDHTLPYSSVKLQNLVGRLRDHTLPYSLVKLQNLVGRLRAYKLPDAETRFQIPRWRLQDYKLPDPLGKIQILSRQLYEHTLLSAITMVSVGALFVGLVPRSDASLEVLSDMDCVIEPSATIELGAAVPGLLAESFYDRSDFVSAGTIMARLENDVEKVALRIAEEIAGSSTAVELREITAEFGDRTRVRNASLLKKAVISQQAMDQVAAEASIASLQVAQEQESLRLAAMEVERSRALFHRREIRSPIDGTVIKRYKSAGEYVDSEPVYQLAQLDPLHVEVIVPIEYLGSLESGMHAGVTITVPGFENRIFDSMVRRIDSVADAASATYGVRLELENPDLTIPSGVRCQVDFFAS